MNKNIIILSLVCVVVCFLSGGIVGVVLFKLTPKQVQIEKTANVIFSKTISSITASGVVASINGRNLTISKDGEEITILIPEGKPIYILGSTENGKQQKVSFEDIKKGDSVNVGLKVNGQEQLEGQSVMIFSQAQWPF